MARKPSARRYARAAFDIAVEHDALESWAADLAAVGGALQDEDFLALLEAPQVPLGAKLDGVRTVLGETGVLVQNLVGLLVTRGQARLLPDILSEFGTAADEHRGVARAEVVTAVPMDGRERDMVRERLAGITGKDIVISELVDPSILGGLVARVGDRLIDGSTRARLDGLRETVARPPARPTEAA